MRFCVKHQQLYPQTGYCVYCGNPPQAGVTITPWISPYSGAIVTRPETVTSSDPSGSPMRYCGRCKATHTNSCPVS